MAGAGDEDRAWLDDPGRLKSEVAAVWNQAGVWALGRLGARIPQYGPLNTLVPVETVQAWLQDLMHVEAGGSNRIPFAAVQMARRTGDRYRDLSSESRAQVRDWLSSTGAPPHYLELVESGGLLDTEEQKAAFGDSLPAGIRVT